MKYSTNNVSVLNKVDDLQILPEELEVVSKVEKLIGYSFKKKQLLILALTHRSYINVLKRKKSQVYTNERVEFLGDAVLELAISEHLYKKYKDRPEGVLTLIRAATVRTESLAETLQDVGIHHYIFLGLGEEKTDGRNKPYILANMYEAIIGAIYLDSGFRNAKAFINRTLFKKIDKIVKTNSYVDPKTRLQEITQKYFKITPVYEIINEQGLAHEKTYTAVIKIKEKILGTGTGPSKQKAQEEAAINALKSINKIIKENKNAKN